MRQVRVSPIAWKPATWLVPRGAGFVSLAVALLAAADAGAGTVQVHGLIDVVAAEPGAAYETNRLTRGDSNFDAYGVRLFVNAEVNPRVKVFSQFVYRDASMPYVDGAHVMFTPWAGRDAHLLAGKIPWPIGTWAPRTYSSRNPLIGTPLLYQYHSTALWYDVPPDADALIGAAGTGQGGVNDDGFSVGSGMPIVDDSYWDVGVTVVGSQRPLEYAVGIVAGTPGWGSTSQDENGGKTVLGRIGFAPAPALRAGVSAARGPYLDRSVRSQLPPGAAVEDYLQRLAMADLEILVGHVELRAEAAHNVWESPWIGDLEVNGGYIEAKVALSIGAFVAGRWDALRFGRVLDSGGALQPWDHDVTRLEGGAGYRFDRDVVAKLIVQRTSIEPQGAPAFRPTLVAAQLSVGF
jgi:hypothetical protein